MGAADSQMVASCLNEAASMYSKVIKAETGADKSCKLVIDTRESLPATTIGGVMLLCQNNKITIDNTIDLRLKLVMEQDKPAIRSLLFPYSLLVVIALRQRMNSGGNFLLILVQ